MIVFIGDSFTWGQGLYFEEWIKNGISIDEISKYKPELVYHENLSYKDHLYRKTNRFANLVAKHFDKNHIVTTVCNGGSNYDIYYELKNLRLPREIPILIVIQLTDWLRPLHKIGLDDIGDWYQKNDLQYIHEYYKSKSDKHDREYQKLLIKNQISLIENTIEKLGYTHSKINHIYCNWNDDFKDYVSPKVLDRFVDISYNGSTNKSFDFLVRKNGISLKHTLGIFDSHLSSEGHQIVADSIIKKVKSMNIDF
jgi:hypothetical protein